MTRHTRVVMILAATFFVTAEGSGQPTTTSADLSAILQSTIDAPNRTAAALTDGSRRGLRLSAGAGEGPAYIPGIELADGVIELDIRGQDLQGQSFVGVAFHGVDGQTYDAIYFRPFNFRAADPVRRARAVQYIAQPVYTWDKLRAEHPGKYEQAVSPVPDPNEWFRARIVIRAPTISVFVNDAAQPTLVVDQLSSRNKGRVGIWVGNGSAGDFANFTIIQPRAPGRLR